MHLKAITKARVRLHTEVASGWGTAPGPGLWVTAEWLLAYTYKDFILLIDPYPAPMRVRI